MRCGHRRDRAYNHVCMRGNGWSGEQVGGGFENRAFVGF